MDARMLVQNWGYLTNNAVGAVFRLTNSYGRIQTTLSHDLDTRSTWVLNLVLQVMTVNSWGHSCGHVPFCPQKLKWVHSELIYCRQFVCFRVQVILRSDRFVISTLKIDVSSDSEYCFMGP